MSNFENALSTVESVIEEYDQIRLNTQKVLQEKMKTLFDAFFESFPEVKTVHWVQYTPYFNDGDECVFGVYEPYFSSTEWGDLESFWGEDDDGNLVRETYDYKKRCYVTNENVSEQLANAMEKIRNILQAPANEDVMLAMFDNHVWVLAHRGGFEVADHSHD